MWFKIVEIFQILELLKNLTSKNSKFSSSCVVGNHNYLEAGFQELHYRSNVLYMALGVPLVLDMVRTWLEHVQTWIPRVFPMKVLLFPWVPFEYPQCYRTSYKILYHNILSKYPWLFISQKILQG